MSSSAYYGGDGTADLSTVDANPSVYNGADYNTAQDISTIANTAGQWGATIASVVTGNPVQSVVTPSGQVQTIGAAGSQVSSPLSSGSSTLLLLLVGAVVLYLILK